MNDQYASNVRHGHCSFGRRTPEATAWQNMKARCHNPRNPRYADYGGRGIAVCERWRNSFEAFYEDLGPRPSPKHQIDRIRNEVGYEPGNCEWRLPTENMTNRRNTRFVVVDGEEVPLATIAHLCGVPANTLRARILSGWTLERATSQPPRSKMPNGAGRARDLRT